MGARQVRATNDAPAKRREFEPQLYRGPAVAAFGQQEGGRVLAVAPPCARLAVLLAVLILVAIAAALYLVEVLERAPAVGVLMPPDGMLTVAAPAAARVTRLAVRAGDAVQAGDVLATVSAERSDAGGVPVAAATVASLRAELALAGELHAGRAALGRERVRALGGELAAARRRVALAAENLAVEKARLAIRRQQLERARTLGQRGLLARAALEERNESWLAARGIVADRRRALLDAESAAAELTAEAGRQREELRLAALEHQRERQRLERQIREASMRAVQQIVAPRAASVAHVAVTLGSDVRAGQRLLSLYEPGRELEAWLYVATSDIGRLRPGLEVRLKLDAWPHQLYGAPSATITSISAGALEPGALTAPLVLSGPVFEVRAQLERQTISGLARHWRLKPGTSFRAELIRERFRLYQWLGRNLKRAVGGGAV